MQAATVPNLSMGAAAKNTTTCDLFPRACLPKKAWTKPAANGSRWMLVANDTTRHFERVTFSDESPMLWWHFWSELRFGSLDGVSRKIPTNDPS